MCLWGNYYDSDTGCSSTSTLLPKVIISSLQFVTQYFLRREDEKTLRTRASTKQGSKIIVYKGDKNVYPCRRFMLKGITMLYHAAVAQCLYTSAGLAISDEKKSFITDARKWTHCVEPRCIAVPASLLHSSTSKKTRKQKQICITLWHEKERREWKACKDRMSSDCITTNHKRMRAFVDLIQYQNISDTGVGGTTKVARTMLWAIWFNSRKDLLNLHSKRNRDPSSYHALFISLRENKHF